MMKDRTRIYYTQEQKALMWYRFPPRASPESIRFLEICEANNATLRFLWQELDHFAPERFQTCHMLGCGPGNCERVSSIAKSQE